MSRQMNNGDSRCIVVCVRGSKIEFPVYTDSVRLLLDKYDDMDIVSIERNSSIEPIPPFTLYNVLRWLFWPRMLVAMWWFPCCYAILWRGRWKRWFGSVTFLDGDGAPFKYKQDAEREECRLILSATRDTVR